MHFHSTVFPRRDPSLNSGESRENEYVHGATCSVVNETDTHILSFTLCFILLYCTHAVWVLCNLVQYCAVVHSCSYFLFCRENCTATTKSFRYFCIICDIGSSLSDCSIPGCCIILYFCIFFCLLIFYLIQLSELVTLCFCAVFYCCSIPCCRIILYCCIIR
jgi:hypothetical protein